MIRYSECVGYAFKIIFTSRKRCSNIFALIYCTYRLKPSSDRQELCAVIKGKGKRRWMDEMPVRLQAILYYI